MSTISKVKKLYNQTFTDELLIRDMVSVVDDMFTKKFPDSSPMSAFYTIKEVLDTQGFYASIPMLNEMTDVMIGRCIRGCFIQLGLSFDLNRATVEFILSTNVQRDRIVPIIVAKLIQRYGHPVFIDEAKINDLCTRAQKFTGL